MTFREKLKEFSFSTWNSINVEGAAHKLSNDILNFFREKYDNCALVRSADVTYTPPVLFNDYGIYMLGHQYSFGITQQKERIGNIDIVIYTEGTNVGISSEAGIKLVVTLTKDRRLKQKTYIEVGKYSECIYMVNNKLEQLNELF